MAIFHFIHNLSGNISITLTTKKPLESTRPQGRKGGNLQVNMPQGYNEKSSQRERIIYRQKD
jgi:hypothetical protein